VKLCAVLEQDISLLRRTILCGILSATVAACGATDPSDSALGLEPTSIDISGANTFVVGPIVFQGSDGRINYHVTVTNRAASPITVQYGDCWGFLQLFSSASRTGTPVFDEGNLGQACLTYQRTETVAVGDSLVLTRQIPTGFPVGVPAGKYFAAVRSAPNGRQQTFSSGELNFRP